MRRDLLAKSLSQLNEAPSSPDSLAKTSSPIVEEEPKTPSGPRSLQAMSNVLSQVSSQAAQMVDTREIADSALQDRFDTSDGLDDLIASIRASGQEIPVLLRYRRGAGQRYEVVYGRRRIAACRELGIPVRALIREMEERDALKSLARENSARLQRSFIEQAVFATRLEEYGFDKDEICGLLAVDKTTLSRLSTVARDVPIEVIEHIGSGHEIGRRPWMELRKGLKEAAVRDTSKLLEMIPDEEDPLKALQGLIDALRTATLGEETQHYEAAPVKRSKLMTVGDKPVRFVKKRGKITIETTEEYATDFIEYLEDRLPQIFDSWSSDLTCGTKR
ncbi:plasmid partitioning protein RepB-20 (plasmid) [Sulfitobacter indolifex]|uniref:plasmid partitioning protein RepB n=1 Tax=Sulfitobacter indolifex TaxID=225422 RepID=UPI001FAE2DFD|nr:plasmid partitioning protein RepB [Sulfitobacter indolifex]UOA20423.1 plasmid partitioning protein RepB-20 [Sulfitobacter indolifex]